MKHVMSGSLLSVFTLAEKIDEYVSQNGERPSFIVMSSTTHDLVEEVCRSVIFGEAQLVGDHSEFHGVPIAICDAVSVGEFKIV